MAHGFFYTVNGYRHTMHSTKMLEALGVIGGKLPKDGLAPRMVQGVRVWAVPFVEGRPRKSSQHRVRCECPDCGVELSAGRLFQHKCKPEDLDPMNTDDVRP